MFDAAAQLNTVSSLTLPFAALTWTAAGQVVSAFTQAGADNP
jgi:hypothetical protein